MHKTLLPNGLGVFQPRGLPRFSLDAYLLAGHVPPPAPGCHCLECGTGCGVISLLLAQKFPEALFFALELLPTWAEALGQTRDQSGLANFSPLIGDFLTPCLRGPFELILGNPPYRDPDRGRLPPDPLRRAGRFFSHLPPEDLFREARRLLAPTGRLWLIFPSSVAAPFLKAAKNQGFHSRLARRIFSRPGGQKSWEVRVFAVQSTKVESNEARPTSLYGETGEKSDLLKAIEKYEGCLPDLNLYGS